MPLGKDTHRNGADRQPRHINPSALPQGSSTPWDTPKSDGTPAFLTPEEHEIAKAASGPSTTLDGDGPKVFPSEHPGSGRIDIMDDTPTVDERPFLSDPRGRRTPAKRSNYES
jgi:hypothetical protein